MPKQPISDYARYSSLGFQMLAFILLSVGAGIWFDDYFKVKTHIFAAILSIIGVLGAITYVIMSIMKQQEKEN